MTFLCRLLAGALLLVVVAGCGPPQRTDVDPSVPSPVGDQAYLVRKFSWPSDAQSWVNEHWPMYRLLTVSGGSSKVYILCHVERGACDPPVVAVMPY